MRIIFLSITLTILLASSPVWAVESEKSEMESAFKQADIIADDHLDTGEFDLYHLKIFYGLDKNDDGSLVRDECYNGCFSTNLDEGISSKKDTGNYIFEAVDQNHNKQATEAEYISYARKQFKEYDRNTDHFMNKEEFFAFYQGMDERAFFVKNTATQK